MAEEIVQGRAAGRTAHASGSAISAQTLAERYRHVRHTTERLCEPLATEDYVIQSMPDVSPTKWHLAHTSWFFEALVLKPGLSGYTPLDPMYNYLFNSYYNTVGVQWCRPRRGLLSRPTVEQVYAFRRFIDEHMDKLFQQMDEKMLAEYGPVIEIGLNHEQQHQELLQTDIKHVLASNPLHPAYREQALPSTPHTHPMKWIDYPEGLHWIGHEGGGFFYDNEGPRHRVFLEPFQVGSRLVTNGEYLQFMEEGGYQRAEHWLSDGWNTVRSEGWEAPLYWEKQDGQWWQMTLAGFKPVDPSQPVCHVSLYEADAFARWAGARLPTEEEWEVASAAQLIKGNFLESGYQHPAPLDGTDPDGTLAQLFGDVWEWTGSAYSPYPGYRPAEGALGEYNGKFMCNQMVLRGGSCATPVSHIRRTYRNFFPPHARWQFAGIRLARQP